MSLQERITVNLLSWSIAAILLDSVAVVVVCTRQQAIPLARITTRKSINGFPLLSYMYMGSSLKKRDSNP